MKKILFLLVLCTSVSLAQLQVLVDSASFTRPATNATAYAAGDIVRDTATISAKFMKFGKLSRVPADVGYIVALQLDADTANQTNANFTVIFFDDTTGLGASLPADNAAFQTGYVYNKYMIGIVSVSLTMYGTTGGGATGARAKVENLNIPYRSNSANGAIYAVLVADGAYTPKQGGKFRVRIWVQK
jgi:hypothetical protein